MKYEVTLKYIVDVPDVITSIDDIVELTLTEIAEGVNDYESAKVKRYNKY